MTFSFMLAPMEKMVDSSFREICHRYGADFTFTELIRFETLAKGNPSALERIKLWGDTPTYIQFMGKREDKLEKFLSFYEPKSEGFRGFNFNLGCPSQNYTNQGLGCAMVKRYAKVARMVEIVQDHGYSANVKMRLGMNRKEKEELVYQKLIERVKADFFVVHARYRSQSYEQPPDWNALQQAVDTGKKIIANGDIKIKEDVEKMRDMGCAGVMIGREALINPRIFAELKSIDAPSVESIWKEYLDLVSTQQMNYSKNIEGLTHSKLKLLKG